MSRAKCPLEHVGIRLGTNRPPPPEHSKPSSAKDASTKDISAKDARVEDAIVKDASIGNPCVHRHLSRHSEPGSAEHTRVTTKGQE